MTSALTQKQKKQGMPYFLRQHPLHWVQKSRAALSAARAEREHHKKETGSTANASDGKPKLTIDVHQHQP
jgi:hypothetical protein